MVFVKEWEPEVAELYLPEEEQKEERN
jgi:hypothetical protein